MQIEILIPSNPSSGSNTLLAVLGILIPSIGIIIAGILTFLKYRLDQANYNKGLFKERFEIFVIIKDIIVKIIKGEKSYVMSDAEWEDLTLHAYALFGEETYSFIDKFKENVVAHRIVKSIDDLQAERNMLDEHSNSLSSIESSIKKREEINQFFAKLADAKALLAHFPELKLRIYQDSIPHKLKAFFLGFYLKNRTSKK